VWKRVTSPHVLSRPTALFTFVEATREMLSPATLETSNHVAGKELEYVNTRISNRRFPADGR
jgi:hypothetical protein